MKVESADIIENPWNSLQTSKLINRAAERKTAGSWGLGFRASSFLVTVSRCGGWHSVSSVTVTNESPSSPALSRQLLVPANGLLVCSFQRTCWAGSMALAGCLVGTDHGVYSCQTQEPQGKASLERIASLSQYPKWWKTMGAGFGTNISSLGKWHTCSR